MKNSMKVLLLTCLFSVMGMLSSSAQDMTKISKSKDFNFNGATTPISIEIDLTSDFNYLSLSLAGHIYSGEINFEVLDPKGKSKGKFNIQTEKTAVGISTTATSQASGNMIKSFRNPIPGKWMVKIEPIGAVQGNAQIQYEQVYNPKVDLIEIEEIDPVKKASGIKEK